MSNLPFNFVFSDSGTVTVYAKGKRYTFAKDNPHYEKVKEAVKKKDAAEIERLGNLPKAIETYAGSLVKVESGVVHYKNKAIHNSLTKRILRLMAEGFPFDSMLKFLENLMQNASHHGVTELYNFLVHRNLPITENGCFLAYKTVKLDYMDWHTGTVRNQVGDTPIRLERNEVDDNWRVQCSSGYHVGAIEYVTDFHSGEGHIMIVEVNPADVISVPTDESFTKCRVCFYTVVGEMEGELLAQVYRTSQTSFTPSTPPPMSSMEDSYPESHDDEDLDDDDDEDFDDDEDDDDEDEDEDKYGSSEPS